MSAYRLSKTVGSVGGVLDFLDGLAGEALGVLLREPAEGDLAEETFLASGEAGRFRLSCGGELGLRAVWVLPRGRVVLRGFLWGPRSFRSKGVSTVMDLGEVGPPEWGFAGPQWDVSERRPTPTVFVTAGLGPSGWYPHERATPHWSRKTCISQTRAAPIPWWAAASGQWFEHCPLQAQFRQADWFPRNLGMAAEAAPGPEYCWVNWEVFSRPEAVQPSLRPWS